jgi:hypothetical protein
MRATTDGTQLSPCVTLFIELLLEQAVAVASSDVAEVRHTEEMATHFRAGVPPTALTSGGGR